jgi:hypothetical protein
MSVLERDFLISDPATMWLPGYPCLFGETGRAWVSYKVCCA